MSRLPLTAHRLPLTAIRAFLALSESRYSCLPQCSVPPNRPCSILMHLSSTTVEPRRGGAFSRCLRPESAAGTRSPGPAPRSPVRRPPESCPRPEDHRQVERHGQLGDIGVDGSPRITAVAGGHRNDPVPGPLQVRGHEVARLLGVGREPDDGNRLDLRQQTGDRAGV